MRLVILFFLGGGAAYGQSWKAATDGLYPTQQETNYGGYHMEFVTNGPLGKDWIHGSWFDEDSLLRTVAYREGGAWVSLPFTCSSVGLASDIEMYGDTLYMSGYFWEVINQKGDTLGGTEIVKWYNDSVWVNNPMTIFMGPGSDMSTKGDSIVMWGSAYNNATQRIFTQFMSPDGGKTWQYPYSIIHPSDTIAYFGAEVKIEILDNGDVLTINNGSPRGNPYSGLSRWDGQQWHAYGNGLFGSMARVFDFDFYKGELYMGGSFSTDYVPDDPANGIARWDGAQWNDVGGGLVGSTLDMFVTDSVLYAHIAGPLPINHRFGDAAIPYLAGWDGSQWCGTPSIYTQNAPQNFGVIKDTLYASFRRPGVINGDTVGYLAYFDGDYLHGPNAICSTPGLGENEQSFVQEDIQVFPNPASDFLNISWSQEMANASYELLSLDGKLIQNGVLATGDNTLKIASKLSGVFLLKVETQSGVVVKKVFFEK